MVEMCILKNINDPGFINIFLNSSDLPLHDSTVDLLNYCIQLCTTIVKIKTFVSSVKQPSLSLSSSLTNIQLMPSPNFLFSELRRTEERENRHLSSHYCRIIFSFGFTGGEKTNSSFFVSLTIWRHNFSFSVHYFGTRSIIWY